MIFLENISTITYDEGWQNVSEQEYARTVDEEENEPEKLPPGDSGGKPKREDYPRQYLITIQLIICVLIALFAFSLKSFGGDMYTAAHEWYTTQLNRALIFDTSRGFDMSSLTNPGTEDEV